MGNKVWSPDETKEALRKILAIMVLIQQCPFCEIGGEYRGIVQLGIEMGLFEWKGERTYGLHIQTGRYEIHSSAFGLETLYEKHPGRLHLTERGVAFHKTLFENVEGLPMFAQLASRIEALRGVPATAPA